MKIKNGLTMLSIVVSIPCNSIAHGAGHLAQPNFPNSCLLSRVLFVEFILNIDRNIKQMIELLCSSVGHKLLRWTVETECQDYHWSECQAELSVSFACLAHEPRITKKQGGAGNVQVQSCPSPLRPPSPLSSWY